MDELIKAIVQTYGLVGLFIVAPYLGLAILYKDHLKLQHAVAKREDELVTRLASCEKDCSARLATVQDQRVVDAKSISDKLIDLASEQSALNRETNLALVRISDSLTSVQAVISVR